uniref:UPAR/Ly6 domain-containing protein n=1 Tax=Panagrellus redivivus TaxID=6233 RepID=A0A7E4URV1_PANRE
MLLTTAAIRCIRFDNAPVYDEDCNYCGFGNITKNTGNTVNKEIHHQCLSEPVFSADGYSTDHVNVCYETPDFNVQLFLCDYDLCNTGCKGTPVISNGATAKTTKNSDVTTAKYGDAANAEISFVVIFGTVLYYTF